ncbi:hypothetical protein [Arenibaculum pallidiluteum]|uniref:hypothetical protein n=1 Tax=Arenibaculum pallidiluteum TaxID=2812559 RepID=UPI001A956D08|nr:hypothetical protein [Arenibaculum pallidiluteum]
MDRKTAPVSPYLLRPLRSLGEAEADRARADVLRAASLPCRPGVPAGAEAPAGTPT